MTQTDAATPTHAPQPPTSPSWRTTLACACGDRFIDRASLREHVAAATEAAAESR